MNAAGRAFVRLSLNLGYGIIGVHYGFEGLIQDNVSCLACLLVQCLLWLYELH